MLPFNDHTLTIWQLKPGEVLPPHGTAVPYPILVTNDAEALQATLLARDVAVGPIEVVEGVKFFTFWGPGWESLRGLPSHRRLVASAPLAPNYRLQLPSLGRPAVPIGHRVPRPAAQA